MNEEETRPSGRPWQSQRLTLVTAMATFRSDFNSVPNTYNRALTALKKRLTTCFQQWRQRLLLHQQQQHQQHQQQQQQQQQQPRKQEQQQRHIGQFQKLFIRTEYSIFSEKTTIRFHKLKRIFAADKTKYQAESKFKRHSSGKRQRISCEEQVQIVARLLSSTLIATSSSSISQSLGLSSSNSNMTILESNYIGVRDEYPDIDKEIRAILLANAQNGITISKIKAEYRNLTGNAFPLHENITDFLLTIPQVTAECAELGTRIFNIKPSNNNRHLHDMVLQQRPRQRGGSSYSQSSSNSSEPPRLWRSQYQRRVLNSLDQNRRIDLKELEKPCPLPVVEKPPLQQLAIAREIRPVSPMEISEGFVEHNWCYQDNWNHLNNRYQQAIVPQTEIFCELPEQPPPHLQQQQHLLQQQNLQQHLQQHLLDPKQQFAMEVPPNIRKRRYDFTPTTISSGPSQNDSFITIKSDYDAYLLDFPLLGDDFFLYLARMELKCKFKKYEKVLQSGLCVSGQTINAARRRIRHVDLMQNTQIIVNIGSVDIMQGRPLVQIEHDFRQLLNDLHKRSFVPVLTTLAPLANYRHDPQVSEKMLRFNKFIKSEGRACRVIDIHSCLVNENNVVRFDCFQNGPRSVTGSQEPHVFWNKIGRQRVLQMIESKLEY